MSYTYANSSHRPDTITRRRLLTGFAATSAAMAFVGPSFARAASRPEIVIDAPTDGRDATKMIRDQIAAAPDGALIRFPVGQSKGRYRCDFTIGVVGRAGLEIAGPDPQDPAVFWTDRKVNKTDDPQVYLKDVSQRQHWVVLNCSNIVLRNLRVEGPNDVRVEGGYSRITPEYEPEHAFSFPGSAGVVIENCASYSAYGDGVFLGAGAKYAAPKDIVIRNHYVESCGRHGVALTRCERVLIDGLVTRLVGTCGIDIEPNGPNEFVRDVELARGDIDCRQVAIAGKGWKSTHNIAIRASTFRNGLRSWPAIICEPGDNTDRSSNWVVEDNVVTYALQSTVFQFVATDGVVIRRNRQAGPIGSYPAVTLGRCGDHLEVSDNDFGGAPELFLLRHTSEPLHFGNVWDSGHRRDGQAPSEGADEAPTLDGGSPPGPNHDTKPKPPPATQPLGEADGTPRNDTTISTGVQPGSSTPSSAVAPPGDGGATVGAAARTRAAEARPPRSAGARPPESQIAAPSLSPAVGDSAHDDKTTPLLELIARAAPMDMASRSLAIVVVSGLTAALWRLRSRVPEPTHGSPESPDDESTCGPTSDRTESADALQVPRRQVGDE